MVKKLLEIFKRRQYISKEQRKHAEFDLRKELEEASYKTFHKFKERGYGNVEVLFEKISETKIKSNIEKSHKNKALNSFPLSKSILKNVLIRLREFEEKKDFLKPNITLPILSSKLNTNSKYLSKTINLHKKKSFTQYINDLRIEYLINRLNTDKKFTNYTIKAIAEEIGFNTANAFSKAFFKKIGKYPSDFIKDLES